MRKRLQTVSLLNSKLETMKRAKARFNCLKMDQAKLNRDDFDDTFRDVERTVRDSNELDRLLREHDEAQSVSSRGSFRRYSFDQAIGRQTSLARLACDAHLEQPLPHFRRIYTWERQRFTSAMRYEAAAPAAFDWSSDLEAPAPPVYAHRASFQLRTMLPEARALSCAPAPALAFSDEHDLLSDACRLPEVPIEPIVRDMRGVVDKVKQRIEDTPKEQLSHDFYADTVPAQSLLVKRVPAEEYERRRQLKEEQRLAELTKAADDYAKRELDLAWREQSARQRIAEFSREAATQRARARAIDISDHVARERGLRRHFALARDRLFSKVRAQHGYIRERFGHLLSGSSVAARRYQVNWELLPRPVELRLHMIRAVKDRLPRGQYVVLLSMEDRLAGRPLRWSKMHSYTGAGFGTFPAVTKPVKHRGRFHDLKLRISQSVFALCPSRHELQPGNTFILEVFRLADKKQPRDRVVGWTAFPIVSPNFSVVKGKLKLPVLRGEVDRSFDRFSRLEKAISDSLSAWLGNIYIEIRHLPRETIDDAGVLRNEHQVEVDFINKLLHLNRDEHDLTSVAKLHQVRPVAPPSHHRRDDDDDDAQWWHRPQSIFNRRGALARRDKLVKHHANKPTQQSERCESALGSKQDVVDEESDDEAPFCMSVVQASRVCGTEATPATIHDGERCGKLDSGANYDEAGLSLERRQVVVINEAAEDTSASSGAVWWTDVSQDKNLDNFTPSVANASPAHRKPTTHAAIAKTKIRFLWQELFQDLNPDERSSSYTPLSAVGMQLRRCSRLVCHLEGDKWLKTIIFLMAFWWRMYLHYIGQWLLLKSVMRVAVYGFRPRLYTIEFKFSPSSTTALGEVAVVAFGPTFVLLIYCFLATIARLWQQYASDVPEVASHFLAAFGLAALCNPVLIFAVDALARNYSCDTRPGCRDDYTQGSCHCFEGDAFKLWRRMKDEENGGIVGVFYACMIYFIIMCAALAANVYYLIHVHANGRILDTYYRIYGDDFFVPDDFEVSIEEVQHVFAKARRWVGPQDQRRKIVVDDIDIITDGDESALDKSTGTATTIDIIEVQVDGTSWVYRKFFRSPEGMMCEIFRNSARHSLFDAFPASLLDYSRGVHRPQAASTVNATPPLPNVAKKGVLDAQEEEKDDGTSDEQQRRPLLTGHFAHIPGLL